MILANIVGGGLFFGVVEQAEPAQSGNPVLRIDGCRINHGYRPNDRRLSGGPAVAWS